MYGRYHFCLDFKYILNESVAGKKAQNFLKNKLDKGIKELKVKEQKLQEEEKQIIQQKKIIKPEEYKSKVDSLRSKVSTLQKERNSPHNLGMTRNLIQLDILKLPAT